MSRTEIKVYCPDIECESCIKLIKKLLAKEEAEVQTQDYESMTISYNPENLDLNYLLAAIRDLGFRASLKPFERKTLGERTKDFLSNKKKYSIEYRMLKYSMALFVLIIAMEATGYLLLFSQNPEFLARYWPWVLYLDIAVVALAASVWHLHSYRAKFTTMVGMMIGMTHGMLAGMMFGTIIAATNGLFLGATLGMVLAVSVGIYNGKCCGIMGVMEGMMAGVMGGTMGGMIGTMFALDHLQLFMPLFMLMNLIILLGLSYMLFEEVVEHNVKTTPAPINFLVLFFSATLLLFLFLGVMLYGPRTGIAANIYGGVL